MSKFRALLDKRDKYKEQVELAFAIFTIVSYVYSKVQEKKEPEEIECSKDSKKDDTPVYNISSL